MHFNKKWAQRIELKKKLKDSKNNYSQMQSYIHVYIALLYFGKLIF